MDALMNFGQGLFGVAWPAVWTLLKIVAIVAPLMLGLAYLTELAGLSMALGVLFFETIFSDSIPHHVSINNSHLAVITDSQQLAPGFLNAFLLGTAISVIAIVFMWHTRARNTR